MITSRSSAGKSNADAGGKKAIEREGVRMPSTPHMETYFKDFLKEIRLEDEQKDALVNAHTQLRERLEDDAQLGEILVTRVSPSEVSDNIRFLLSDGSS